VFNFQKNNILYFLSGQVLLLVLACSGGKKSDEQPSAQSGEGLPSTQGDKVENQSPVVNATTGTSTTGTSTTGTSTTGTSTTGTSTTGTSTTGTSTTGSQLPSYPSSMVVLGPISGFTQRCSSPITISFKDSAGNFTSLNASKTFNLSSSLAGTFYSSPNCSGSAVTSLTAAATDKTKIFSWMPSWSSGEVKITVSDTAAEIAPASHIFSLSSSIGMVGSSLSNSFLNTNGVAARSRYDGGFNSVTGATLDDAGNLYVSEYNGASNVTSAKVSKWNIAGQSEIGWIGAVSSGLKAVGGAAGCSTASNAKTPGWCNGGWSLYSSSVVDTFTQPQRTLAHNGFLYISDTNRHRIFKYDATTGALIGWVGKIGTTPATGGIGCNTSVTNVATTGWCLGGTSTSGNGDGMLNTPRGLSTDGVYLYIADTGNHRIVRYSLTTGAFSGWYGRLTTPPTKTFNGCQAQNAAGVVTCWSSGGVSGSAAANGSFSSPGDVWVDSQSMYVADTSNHRIQKFSLNVVNVNFVGWMGARNAAPGGTCTGVGANAFTNMWCNGSAGTPVPLSSNGAMSSPSSIWGDANYLFVADTNNHRINRYLKASALASGWTGLVKTTPSGGDAGCVSAIPNFPTPGWCTGGTSSAGHLIGSYYLPQNVIGDGTNLYVADQGNNRVQIIHAAAGQASGFIGAKSTPHTGWSASSSLLTGSISSAASFDDAGVDSGYGLATDGSNIYVSEFNGHRLKKISSVLGEPSGWVGRVLMSPSGGAAGCSTATSGGVAQKWCMGGSAGTGSSNGHFNGPAGTYISGNFIYVADYNNHRIVRYSKEGVPAGWIGKIATSPTGGDTGCAGMAVGNYTPGWCMGGSASVANSALGFKNPIGISGDDAYLFVAESSIGRIQKIRISDGSQFGWVGKLSALPAPTGGVSGCSTMVASGATPGWCLGGGISVAGTGDNMFNNPLSVSQSLGFVYVADYSNNRVVRIDANNGAAAGWIGKAGTTAPLCPTGFTGVANASNPTWCKGSTAAAGSADVQFNGPRGVWADGINLYVSDATNGRIQKIKQSDGTKIGWFGRVSTAPTAGPVGCTSAAVGSITPNWCTGGAAKAGPQLGAFDAPAAITGDADWIYVADLTQNRVVRIKP
jgi:sugar lactone lactonase YvrE